MLTNYIKYNYEHTYMKNNVDVWAFGPLPIKCEEQKTIQTFYRYNFIPLRAR